MRSKKSKPDKTMGIFNGDFASEVYKTIPCRIGYRYARLQVDGSILPCCVTKLSVGNIKNSNFIEVWFSGSYEAFREKTGRIHEEHFHVKDPEWAFCQQCPHVGINTRAVKNMGFFDEEE